MSTAAIPLSVECHRQPFARTLLISTGLALVAWGRAIPVGRLQLASCDHDARQRLMAREAALTLRDAQPRYGFHS